MLVTKIMLFDIIQIFSLGLHEKLKDGEIELQKNGYLWSFKK